MKRPRLLLKLLALVACMLCSIGAAAAVEAYACFTSSDSTLTFYYDDLKSTRPGTTYNLSGFYPGWYNIRTSITKVVFDSSFAGARPTSGANWFNEMTNLQSITGMEYLNTSSMTDMNGMFYQCSGLTTLDVSYFDTANSTDMGGMFYGCSNVGSLDLSHFNTKNVTNMWGMFRDCSSLTTLDLGSFNVTRVTTMSYMFNGCSNLTTIYVGGGWYSTGNTLQECDYIFNGCTHLVGGNGTTYNPNNVGFSHLGVDDPSVGPGYMTGKCYAVYDSDNTTLSFYNDYQASSRESTVYYLTWYRTAPEWSHDNNARNVTQVVFDPSFADVRPTSTYYWFYEMRRLSSVKGMEYLNTSEVTNMSGMFYMCLDLTTICVGDAWSTDAVIEGDNMFYGCSGLVGGQGTTYDENHVDHAYAHIDGGPSNPGYFSEIGPEAYAVYTQDNETLTFYYDNQRSSRPGTTTYGLNTGTEEMEWHENPYYFTHVVFDPSFADARPTTTYRWFYGMSNLVSITGIEYLNTDSVTNMANMFFNCRQLMNLNLSHFNTDCVTSMASMFNNCRTLTSLDLSSFNTANVTTMEYMFTYCMGLTSLDLSSFNTDNVTTMAGMFTSCTGLTSVDLSSFTNAKVRRTANMFQDCSALTTIYASSSWSLPANNYSIAMFLDCTSLVGGMGTTYDADHTDAEYAHIDGGPSNPGYLTAVPVAYACYTSDNTTLTFYFDNQRSTRTGTTYDLNTGSNDPGWLSDGNNTPVTQVVFDSSFADARPTSTYSWFCDMSQLQSFTGMEYLNTEDVTSMTYMFKNCTSLTVIDLSNFNTAKVTNMGAMFYGCTNLTTIYAGDGWTTASVSNTYSTAMFFNCICLVGGQGTTYNILHSNKAYAHIDGGPDNPGYFTEKPSVEAYAVYTEDNSTLTFYYDDQRSSRPGTTIYGLNTGTEEMEWHDNPYYFTRVVFDPSFADARPTTTYRWFYGMSNLVSITGMEYLNTDSVTNMANMFNYCCSLPSVDLSHFNTANVTTMSRMFSRCFALTSLDLSAFNTDNVTTMESMFYYCTALKSVDLSGFTNARMRRTANMFEGCSALTTIYASSSWYLPANNYSFAMFYECTSLVGGQGTTFDANHTDAAYAHIDGGPSNPGYFTEKVDVQPGDANGDTEVNITDVVQMINAVSSSNFSGIDTDAADVNGDTQVNITDVILLINYVSNGHW